MNYLEKCRSFYIAKMDSNHYNYLEAYFPHKATEYLNKAIGIVNKEVLQDIHKGFNK